MIIIEYRNWKLLVDDRPSFTAFPPDGEALLSDRIFCSPEIAVAEAKTFVDKAILREQTRNELDDWVEAGLIGIDRYQKLDKIIAELAQAIASDHLLPDQKQPQQSSESHHSSSP